MKRIMLTVAYDGTNYCGWQMEPTGLSVEEVLNKALSKRLNEDIHVKGVSRTDSGVHALANLCIFDTETPIPPEKICFAVNEVLPEDIMVRKSEEVPPDFHPRKCDSLKTYEYTLYHDSLPNPLVRHYTTYYYRRLDVQKMREGAAYLIGEHDFSSFCSAGSQAETRCAALRRWRLRKRARASASASPAPVFCTIWSVSSWELSCGQAPASGRRKRSKRSWRQRTDRPPDPRHRRKACALWRSDSSPKDSPPLCKIHCFPLFFMV